MNYYCLSKTELRQLIENRFEAKALHDELLRSLVEGSLSAQNFLVGLTYFFSQVLDKRCKDGVDNTGLIDFVFNFENEMLFEFQESDDKFVDFMLKNLRDKNLALEEELIDIQNRLSSHHYGKNLRF